MKKQETDKLKSAMDKLLNGGGGSSSGKAGAEGDPVVTKRTAVKNRDVVLPEIRKDGNAERVTVYMRRPDVAYFEDIRLFLAQNGMVASWSQILRAGLRTLRKDQATQEAMRKQFAEDRRHLRGAVVS